MLVVLFTFGFGFSWMELFFESHSFSIKELILALGHVFTGNTWAHMWYVYCLIGIYVLLPLYKLVADHASDKELKYILGVLFIFEVVMRLTKIFGVELGFYCHINTIYPFWFLMGSAKNRGMLDFTEHIHFGLIFLSSTLLIIASILKTVCEIPFGVLFGYDSVLVVIQGIAIFGLVINMRQLKGIVHTVIMEIAYKSFGIYLVHMFFINIAYKLVKTNPFNIFFGAGVGILVILNLILSYLLVSIMKRIPYINKIV